MWGLRRGHVALLSEELEHLAELADHLLVAPLFEAVRYARGEMALAQCRLERLEPPLDRARQLDDVDAGLVSLDHLADALEVALDGRQAVEDLLFVSLHVRCSHPLREGVDGSSRQVTCRQSHLTGAGVWGGLSLTLEQGSPAGGGPCAAPCCFNTAR